MVREILLLRHAKSDWGSDATTDFDRPLAKRGEKDARAMGVWLRAQGRLPDRILASPALRARETVVRLCEAARIPQAAIDWTPAIYEAHRSTLLSLLARSADHERVMVVGHNPGLEQVLVHLAGDTAARPIDGKLLPTATLAWLALSVTGDPLAPGSATLLSLTRPRDLRR